MTLDPALISILACPKDKGPLLYFGQENFLYNPRLQLRYLIKDNIPIMLVEEAQTLSDSEHLEIIQRAQALGIKPNFDPSPKKE